MPTQSKELDFPRRVLDHASSMLAYWDAGLVCRYANAGCRHWFGLGPEEVVGTRMRDLLGETIFALNEPHVLAVLAGRPQLFERAVPGPDGIVRHSLARYHPDVIDAVVVGFIAEVADVSPLKQLELALMEQAAIKECALAALKKRDAALDAAQRLGKIGSWEWEVEADITIWSPELYRLFGRDPGRLSPAFSEHAALYTAASWLRLRDAVNAALTHGTPYRLQLEYVRPGQGHGWLDVRGEVERNALGSIVALRGTAQDVTESQAMLATVRQQAHRLALALEAAELGVWRYDVAHATLDCEDARARDFLGLAGHAGAMHADMFCAELLHPDDAGLFQAAMSACVRDGSAFQFKGRVRRHGAEGWRWVACSGHMPAAPGASATLIATVADFSGSVAAAQALSQAVSDLTEADVRRTAFLSILGHELRNSLAPVTAGVQLLGLQAPPATLHKVAGAMLRQVRHLERLVDDLYDPQRARDGALPLQRSRISLNEVVHAARDMVQVTMDKHGHRFTIHCPQEQFIVNGDAVRLTQALVNLLCNAAKFTPPHGVIALAVDAGVPGTARITVADNGIGIAPGRLDDIFGMYVRIPPESGMAGEEGLGIGLYLARHLVERHGGTLTASSDGIDRGCTMVICLPLDGVVQEVRGR